MYDATPPHFLLAVWEFLGYVFSEQWIGECEPTEWPARVPDVSPLHFNLWGHMKSTVFTTEVNDLQDLQQQIQDGFKKAYDTRNFPASQTFAVRLCNIASLYCGVDSPSVGLAVHFSCNLYR
jgi:hypothetical protein